MMHRAIKRRRRDSLTNYKKRIALLKSGLTRLVVRKTNRSVLVQLVNYDPAGDKVLTTAKSDELSKYNWPPRRNMPTAYLTGMLAAKKAKKLNVGEAVLDIGLYKPVKSSVIFSAAKGAVDGGMKVLSGIELDMGRASGQHIAGYAKALRQDEKAYGRQFAGYLEKKVEPEKLPELFEAVKRKISSE